MRTSKSTPPFSAIALLAILAILASACAPMWRQLRESERRGAVERARSYAKRGDCAETLVALDHAESSLDIGRFAEEATQMRVICYERLGQNAIAHAHRRLFEEFYERPDPAYPTGLGDDVFRVKTVPDANILPVPSGYIIPPPNYSEFARRSHIVGRVVVSFEIASDDTPKAIRILEMPHPLLATWAIEAVAQGRRKNLGKGPPFIPEQRYITTFAFAYHWAKSGQSVEPEPDAPF